jgi:DNA-directed RNA polymerase subunit RPC12/RpoP
MSKEVKILKQIELQEKIQKLADINVVTCGHCGNVLLHERNDKEIECPYCETIMDVCDCPDLFYSGIENNTIEARNTISVAIDYSVVDGVKIYKYNEMLSLFEEEMSKLNPIQYSTTSR